MASLRKEYAEELHQLYSTVKYQRFNQVRNFYDRPQNRFWGVMDRIHAPAIYEGNGQNYRNLNGLKFFKGCDRETVFLRQQKFCRDHGVFISDVVRAIATTDFRSVYDNFSDKVVDRSAVEFNTDHLIEIIRAYPNARVVFNVKESGMTPSINRELGLLKSEAGVVRSHWPPSTSGAAGNNYPALIPHWGKALRSES